MPSLNKSFRAALRVSLAALLLAAGALAAQARDDAKDVARDIYRQVERACEDRSREPYNLATIAEQHFVADLKESLDRAYRDQALGFDILIDGQDCQIRDVDLDEAGDDDDDDRRGETIVRAEFKNFCEKRRIDLVMVREGGRWMVADIVYRHREWSLRQELADVGK